MGGAGSESPRGGDASLDDSSLDFAAYAFVRYLNNPERGALRVFNNGRGALVYANLAAVPLQSLEFGWSAVAVLGAADLDAVTEEEAFQAATLLARVKAEVR